MSISLTTEQNYLNFLTSLFQISHTRGIQFGLERMRRLHDLLGCPADSLKLIHIAGTNGKGSVSTKIASGLEFAGFKVGLFTSPHLDTFRERIQLNRALISKEEILALYDVINGFALQEKITPSFFEMTTLMAFSYFAAHHVDFAVIEVGLGGRYDATNIISPHLCVITSIDFDHENLLGNDIDAIAFEKGGIIKEGVPLVLGPKSHKKFLSVIAKEKNASLFEVEGTFEDYEMENRAIAKKSLSVLGIKERAIEQGIEVTPPCRFEMINRQIPVIFDVAHNIAGIKALIQRLSMRFPKKKIRFVLALGADKDHEKILEALIAFGFPIHITKAPKRFCPLDKLNKIFEKNKAVPASSQDDTLKCCQEAYQQAQKNQEILVITGTFYIMSLCKEALGIPIEKDPLPLSDY